MVSEVELGNNSNVSPGWQCCYRAWHSQDDNPGPENRNPETEYGPGTKGKIHSGKIEDDSLWRKGEEMT